jgi:flavin reductase (DIM6/NTAB) family NADH-FMN oxidoreductase RutF
MSVKNNFHYYEPRNGHRLAHDPFKAIIGPRPIGWISTVSADGILNLAPYSYFNCFSTLPPVLGFSSLGYKDTVKNIADTKQFVWNICTKPLVTAMNTTATEVGPEVDEFALAGVTPVASRMVAVPKVQESPVAFECRMIDLFQMKDSDQNLINSWFIFGEVVGIHIREDLLINGIYDTAGAQHVVRGGGPGDYFDITKEQLFQLNRPT